MWYFVHFTEGNLLGASELLNYNTPSGGGGMAMANSYHGATTAGFASYPAPFSYDAPIEHSAIPTGKNLFSNHCHIYYLIIIEFF